MEYDPTNKQIRFDRTAYRLPAGVCAPAPLIKALFQQADSSLEYTSQRIKHELSCCAEIENALQRILNALHDLPLLFDQRNILVSDMEKVFSFRGLISARMAEDFRDGQLTTPRCLAEQCGINVGNNVLVAACRESFRTLLANTGSFLIRRGIILEELVDVSNLARIVREYSAVGQMRLIFQQSVSGFSLYSGIFNTDLSECCIISDALFKALSELRVSLKQHATITREAFHRCWERLHYWFREYRGWDKIRSALVSSCKQSARCVTTHPPMPTVLYDCVRPRPRLFPFVINIQRGTSLEQAIVSQFDDSSRVWQQLRNNFLNNVAVRSFGERWDLGSSVAIRSIFSGRTGSCRVLHVAVSNFNLPDQGGAWDSWQVTNTNQLAMDNEEDENDNWSDDSSSIIGR